MSESICECNENKEKCNGIGISKKNKCVWWIPYFSDVVVVLVVIAV